MFLRFSLSEPHFHLYLTLSTCNHMIHMLIPGVRCSLRLVSHILCLQFILVPILTGYSIRTAYVSTFTSIFVLPMKRWSKCTFINRIICNINDTVHKLNIENYNSEANYTLPLRDIKSSRQGKYMSITCLFELYKKILHMFLSFITGLLLSVHKSATFTTDLM